jgi:ABC-type amino acid transport system permease subunit
MAVYEKDGENYISLAKPTILLSVVSNTELESMGKEIETKLIEVIEKVK